MKKALIGIGFIGILYVFISFILPKYVGVPMAAYESYRIWKEHEKEYFQKKANSPVFDSIRNFPVPIGSISDYENVFSKDQINTLTTIIADYEQKTTREIAIVSIQAIEPYDNIAAYTIDLSNEWGIGKAETNNGLLILFSTNLRKIRIATGLGTEKILTDTICKRIIDQVIIPEFKKGNHYNGIEKGLIALINAWE